MRRCPFFVTAAIVACIVAPVANAFQGAPGPLKLHSRSSSPGQIKEGLRAPSLPIRPGHRLRLNGGLGSLGIVATAAAAVAAAPVEKFRKDYKVPDYSIGTVDLTFKIFKGHTQVLSSLKIKRKADASPNAPLRLDAEDLVLNAIKVDGKELISSDFSWVQDDALELKGPFPDEFTLETDVTIKPEENTELSGLYQSTGVYCTQCEAEGFRRITPFQDRPDIMASYLRVRIEADKKACPVLLSNGNLIAQGELEDGRHFAEWQDPFPKPSYLFAVVAGDLGSIKDTFTTKSGRKVALEIFSEHDKVDQLSWAMESLKQSMKWDEERFGLEYDLDVYNIVAVSDFNMGAMENKGLNVFNTAYVLAKPSTATDADFEAIQGVIAHEYFHNWTGNRVTCRDWFQLTLKEGLTVFRDQQFSMDMSSEAVKRVEDVRVLRAAQFPQDNSPMAHPIRPESYIAMDNFYTATVYNKGAEVIGMYQTILGREGFRKGMDLYFQRHDGTAVTCDDFRAAMADANGVDLKQFERWYTQAGTPQVKASGVYDAAAKRYTLTLEQSCGPSPGQPTKEPYHIPVRVGLLGRASGGELCPERVLDVREARQTFVFENIAEAPVASILRGFSAPVKLVIDQTDEDLAFLMSHDTDSFNRWEAGQKLFTRTLLANVAALQAGREMSVGSLLVEAVRRTLNDADADRSLKAYALGMPSLSTVAEEMSTIDPDALAKAYRFTQRGLALALRADLEAAYAANQLPVEPFRADQAAIGMRRLKNTCLNYLSSIEDKAVADLCLQQATQAGACMTDILAATSVLASCEGAAAVAREAAMSAFYDKHAKGNDLLICKWLRIQAGADIPECLDRVNALLSHPEFSLKNPNKSRALIGAFSANLARFHAADGSGYRWLADRILQVDKINPQNAARLTAAFSTFRRYDQGRQEMIRAQLQRLVDAPGLSKDTFEIVSRSLKG